MSKNTGIVLLALCAAVLAGCGLFGQKTNVETIPLDPAMPRGEPIIEYNGDVFFQVDPTPHPYPGLSWDLYKRPANSNENIRVAALPDDGYLQVVDGKIYLATDSGRLCLIDPDDFEVTTILYNLGGGHEFVFTPEWLYGQNYAISSSGWVGEIYRVRYDGSERTGISSDAGLGLQSDGEYLYYFSYTDNAIVKTDMEGGNKEILAGPLRKQASNEPGEIKWFDFHVKYAMALYDGWIYYIDDYQLYKVRTNGEDNTDLNAKAQGWFTVSGSAIAVFDKYDGQDLEDAFVDVLGVSSISTLDLDGKNKRLVVPDGAGLPVSAGKYIYFWTGDPYSLHRFVPGERGIELVYQEGR